MIEIQFIVVVVGTTFQTDHDYMDGFTASRTPTVTLAPLPTTDVLDLELNGSPNLGGFARAHATQLSILPPVTDVETLSGRVRLMPGISLTVQTPVIINSKPMSPAYYWSSDSSATLIQGIGHIWANRDPNPIWDSTNNVWLVSPPAGGVGDARWSVFNFPEPGTTDIPIGTRSTADGTTAVPTSCTGWFPDPATPSAPVWQSNYPFKPELTQIVHVNADGTQYITPKALRFDPHYAQNMFMDMGSNQPMPFTWIIVSLVADHAGGIYRHFLLDAGRNPYNYISARTTSNAGVYAKFPGTREGLGYRSYIGVDRHSMYMSNNSNTQLIVKHPMNHKPRMYYAVFNGSSTRMGNITAGGRYDFKGKLPNETGAHRYYIMGRNCGYLDIKTSAYMHVFEMRYWSRALSVDEINAQYKQLSTTWQFAAYK